MKPSLKFEVLFDDEVISFVGESQTLVGNEHLLSLTNDYSDGNWHYERFNRFIWDNVAETALTYRERESCLSSPMTILSRAADRLRICDDSGTGSELAEIFLYGISVIITVHYLLYQKYSINRTEMIMLRVPIAST